jgi:putative ABC transport system permease protein
VSAVLRRKARADLGRHRARTVLTVLTLALALASVATLAVPGLIDRRMDDEVRATRLADVTLPTEDLVLAPGTLDDLQALPNVTAAEARTQHAARVTVGEHLPEQATVWGLDVDGSAIDVVRVDEGSTPGPGEVLVDGGNTGAGAGEALRAGDRVTVTGADGDPITLTVSGRGGSLATSPTASPDGSSEPVFYVDPATAERLTGGPEVDEILLRLDDEDPAAADATVAAARDVLREAAGRDVVTGLPDVREPGDWPGRALVEQITSLFLVVTLLAFVSALFLVANTMNTLIAEQSREIAVMKAIGGRRRQVAGVFAREALLVGVAGAVVGTVLGVAVASALAGYFTGLFGVAGGLAVDVPMVVATLVLGPLVAVVAALPALRRGLRRSVAAGLDDRGVTAGGGRLDRWAARAGFLPASTRLGLRNALRQRRRSAATVAQITLAVAAALALLGLGGSIAATIDDVYDHLAFDVAVEADDGAADFDAATRRLVEDVDGVEAVSPVLIEEVEHGDTRLVAAGVDPGVPYRPALEDGRWLRDDELDGDARVAVLGPAAARAAGVEVGDEVTLTAARGPFEVEVVGIDSANLNMGMGVFVPRATLAAASGRPADAAGELWISVAGTGSGPATAADRDAIDRAALAVDDALASAGHALDVERTYVQQADEQEGLDAILAVQRLMGLLIVGVGMLGLVNTITMGVIERTRELGVLRCLGARARDIRRSLRAETLALVAAGWLLGVPVGWVLLQGLRQVATALTDMELPSVYPPGNAALVLVGAAVLALGALVLPRRRAVRLRPGVALRYE